MGKAIVLHCSYLSLDSSEYCEQVNEYRDGFSLFKILPEIFLYQPAH